MRIGVGIAMKRLIGYALLLMGITLTLVLGVLAKTDALPPKSIVGYMHSDDISYAGNIRWSVWSRDYFRENFVTYNDGYTRIMNISPHRNWIFIEDYHRLQVLDSATGSVWHTYDLNSFYNQGSYLTNDISWSPNGRKVIVELGMSHSYSRYLVLDIVARQSILVESFADPIWLDDEWLLVTDSMEYSLAKIRIDGTEKTHVGNGRIYAITPDKQWLLIDTLEKNSGWAVFSALSIDGSKNYEIPTWCCLISDNSQWLTDGHDIIHIPDGQVIQTITELHPWYDYLAFTPDSRYLIYEETIISDSTRSRLVIFDLKLRTTHSTPLEFDETQNFSNNYHVDISPDSEWLVADFAKVGSYIAKIDTLSTNTPAIIEMPNLDQPSWQGNWLYYVDSDTERIYRLNPETQVREWVSKNIDAPIYRYEWSQGERLFLNVVVSSSYEYWLLDTETLEVRFYYPTEEYPTIYGIIVRQSNYHQIWLGVGAGIMAILGLMLCFRPSTPRTLFSHKIRDGGR
jgi:hypothetical protein